MHEQGLTARAKETPAGESPPRRGLSLEAVHPNFLRVKNQAPRVQFRGHQPGATAPGGRYRTPGHRRFPPCDIALTVTPVEMFPALSRAQTR